MYFIHFKVCLLIVCDTGAVLEQNTDVVMTFHSPLVSYIKHILYYLFECRLSKVEPI